MHHTYICDVRWGDMDSMGHVNNVVFADYLQEARIDLLRAHGHGGPTEELTEATLVVSQNVQYVAPLHFDHEPVRIDVWVAQIKAATFTLAYEVYRATPEGRTTYATATTVLTPFNFAAERPRRINELERSQLGLYLEETEVKRVSFGPVRAVEEGHYPVQVRFSDLDVYGHSNNVIYLEYFQEARITMMANLTEALRGAAPSLSALPAMVVAAQHVEYKRPMVLRPEPYDTWTWVARVGSTSMLLEAQICDTDGTVLARGQFVMVFVDRASGASVSPHPDLRAALEHHLPAV